MPKIELNLLKLQSGNTDRQTSVEQPARAVLPRAFFIVSSMLVVLLAATSAFSYSQSQYDDSALHSALQSLFSFDMPFFSENGDKQLAGENEDRINILFLGIGGKEHEGPQLSDTILVASLQPSTKRVALFSIPRDLLVQMDDYGWRKINHANSFGESKEPGTGPLFASKVIESTFGIPIHYTARVDFEGFAKIIDIVGGVTVVVDNNFTDYTYPNGPNKYQMVSFQAGEQHMDGKTALQFVRSRHSLMNNEGTDFARSKRQQKVIAALKEELLSPFFLANPAKITKTLGVIQEHLLTSFQGWELFRLAKVTKNIDSSSITNIVFDDGPNGFLASSMAEGAYVLQPRSGSFDEIKEKVRMIFSEQQSLASTTPSMTKASVAPSQKTLATPPKSTPSSQSFSLGIQNGTSIEGLAGRVATLLTSKGYEIQSIKNAPVKDREKTVIYDFGGADETRLQELSSLFSATVLQMSRETIDPAATSDVVVVLGSDAKDSTAR